MAPRMSPHPSIRYQASVARSGKVAAHDQRVGEVGQHVDGDEQGGAGDGRTRERQRDRPEDREPAGAERLRRRLQARRRRGQHSLDRQHRIREVGQGLDDPEARPPEHRRLEAGELVRDEPEPPEHQQIGEPERERRREERQDRNETKRSARGHLRPAQRERVNEAEDGGADRRQHDHPEGVRGRPHPAAVLRQVQVVRQRRKGQHLDDRQHDEEREQSDHHDSHEPGQGLGEPPRRAPTVFRHCLRRGQRPPPGRGRNDG